MDRPNLPDDEPAPSLYLPGMEGLILHELLTQLVTSDLPSGLRIVKRRLPDGAWMYSFQVIDAKDV